MYQHVAESYQSWLAYPLSDLRLVSNRGEKNLRTEVFYAALNPWHVFDVLSDAVVSVIPLR